MSESRADTGVVGYIRHSQEEYYPHHGREEGVRQTRADPAGAVTFEDVVTGFFGGGWKGSWRWWDGVVSTTQDAHR